MKKVEDRQIEWRSDGLIGLTGRFWLHGTHKSCMAMKTDEQIRLTHEVRLQKRTDKSESLMEQGYENGLTNRTHMWSKISKID